MLYVPRHLPNRLEYKVLSCISVHYQSRMTSNGIAITPSRFHSAGRVIWGIGAILVLYLGMLWMLLLGDLRTICWGGLDGCKQMCTLHAVFVLGVCLRETWTVVETFLNTSWWNILYSGSSQEFIIRVTSYDSESWAQWCMYLNGISYIKLLYSVTVCEE